MRTRHWSGLSPALAQATYREWGSDAIGTHQPKSSAATAPTEKPVARSSSASPCASLVDGSTIADFTATLAATDFQAISVVSTSHAMLPVPSTSASQMGDHAAGWRRDRPAASRAGALAPPSAGRARRRMLNARRVEGRPPAALVVTGTLGIVALARHADYDPRAPMTYSITRSAWRMSVRGIVRRSALAVFRLISNSNFVGCSTGRSAGLDPLRIRSTYVAARL
jgi:hypothetical protein